MFPFSVDLKAAAIKQLNFLQSLHSLGASVREPTPKTFQRYKHFWLPLVQTTTSGSKLVPPSDIAWLWHCHRLAPRHYKEYIRKNFCDVIVEPKYPFYFQTKENQELLRFSHHDILEEDMQATRELWAKEYPGESFFLLARDYPDESFFVSGGDTTAPQGKESSTKRSAEETWFLFGEMDLLASTERQKAFLWQMGRPSYSQDAFLNSAVGRYHKFLMLKRIEFEKPVVPTYQIDLMWHSHILSSITMYDKDCFDIIGRHFHHDDSFNDRTPGGPLEQRFAATKALWRSEYQEDIAVKQDAYYRGEPPPYFYDDYKTWSYDDYKTNDCKAAWADAREVQHFAAKTKATDANGGEGIDGGGGCGCGCGCGCGG